jgi:hypothetical protein
MIFLKRLGHKFAARITSGHFLKTLFWTQIYFFYKDLYY